ncbi:MAG: SpoVA/SpoVAEb family sporulation membrane protein [Oscillospiraceae bacterium]|nr:SpoVA/SpoVAEb family sporulation membrane protein [Oscillospiraceae bacterium]
MDYLKAFLVGGLICLIGQALIDFTKLTPARILTSFVVAGVILSALGWYGPIAEYGGAGATVPIVGFGHLLFEGVKDAIAENGISGAITGGLTAAAGGIAMSLMCGLVVALLFKSKDQS